MELRLEGSSGIGRGVERVEECPVVWAEVEGQKVSRAVMPRTEAGGYCSRVPVVVKGEEVALAFPAVGGLTQ